MFHVSSLPCLSLDSEVTYEMDMGFDLGELVYRSIAFSAVSKGDIPISLCLDLSGLSSVDQWRR